MGEANLSKQSEFPLGDGSGEGMGEALVGAACLLCQELVFLATLLLHPAVGSFWTQLLGTEAVELKHLRHPVPCNPVLAQGAPDLPGAHGSTSPL